MKEKKAGVKRSDFDLPLVISFYLVMEVIVLFVLCLVELNGVSHIIILSISFVIEFLATFFIILKSNIKSAIIFYILLLVFPVFMNLIAMGIHYITGGMPFVPTVLLLFRSGYDLKGNLLGALMRFIISFRLPSLIAILIASLIYFIKKGKMELNN